jgi:hypothetical protein
VHEVSEGFIRKVGRNYFMILTIDGQRQQRRTGTDDPILADQMLQEWKAQAKIGFTHDARLRYEDMRDHYIASGKTIPPYIQKTLDTFFKGIRIAAITVDRMKEYRRWRENSEQELERKEETLKKEIMIRVQIAGGKISDKQRSQIESEATTWVENGVKATSNRHLSVAARDVQPASEGRQDSQKRYAIHPRCGRR